MKEEGARGQDAAGALFLLLNGPHARCDRSLKLRPDMPVVTLPDGSQRSFDHPVTVDEVAGSIGAGLRKRGARRRASTASWSIPPT